MSKLATASLVTSVGVGALAHYGAPVWVRPKVVETGVPLIEEYLDFYHTLTFVRFLTMVRPEASSVLEWIEELKKGATEEGKEEFEAFLQAAGSKEPYPLSALDTTHESGICAAGILVLAQKLNRLRRDHRNRWWESSYYQIRASVHRPKNSFMMQKENLKVLLSLDESCPDGPSCVGWLSWSVKKDLVSVVDEEFRPTWYYVAVVAAAVGLASSTFALTRRQK